VYAPFGEARLGEQTELTDFGFTGQRLDGSMGGLIYYGLCRVSSADNQKYTDGSQGKRTRF
jgi:hypothetical protein